jgi:hypothetical protein
LACVLHLGGEKRERERERKIEEDEENNGNGNPRRRGDGLESSKSQGGCECVVGMISCVAVCVKVVLLVSLAKALDMSGVKAAELWIGGGAPTRGLPALTGKFSSTQCPTGGVCLAVSEVTLLSTVPFNGMHGSD